MDAQLNQLNACYDQAFQRASTLGEAESRAMLRTLCRDDLFFLCTRILKRRDMNRTWIMQRCREFSAAPDGYLDLWARGHYKSTIISYAATIQEILRNPEITILICANVRPLAKSVLRQIKVEFETNETLKYLFPDILFDDPKKESPKWSEDEGITVKRQSNPKEATIECSGLIDGQPTGKHYGLIIYDDVVTRESVSTPEQIAKTTECWELSLNLRTEHGRDRKLGTRYHFADTYQTMIDRGCPVRFHPCYIVNPATRISDKVPALLTAEQIEAKRHEMGPYAFASQMLLNPIASEHQVFKPEWVRHWTPRAELLPGYNLALIVDPAHSKKKTSDYSAFWVIALAPDQNYYVVDIIRDRLSLRERTDALFALHRRYSPKFTGYERYGMQADIEHVKEEMARQNYHFTITELSGKIAKADRIAGLVPLFEAGRIFLPHSLYRVNYQLANQDLVNVFVQEELSRWPYGAHDDLLDALARVTDAAFNLPFPKAPVQPTAYDEWEKKYSGRRSRSMDPLAGSFAGG